MNRQVTITNGAALAFVCCFLGVFVALGLLWHTARNLEQERAQRQRQDDAAFLANCRNREHEIAVINRLLHLPPTGVDCSKLAVFSHDK